MAVNIAWSLGKRTGSELQPSADVNVKPQATTAFAINLPIGLVDLLGQELLESNTRLLGYQQVAPCASPCTSMVVKGKQ
jgi:hypothetical protein